MLCRKSHPRQYAPRIDELQKTWFLPLERISVLITAPGIVRYLVPVIWFPIGVAMTRRVCIKHESSLPVFSSFILVKGVARKVLLAEDNKL